MNKAKFLCLVIRKQRFLFCFEAKQHFSDAKQKTKQSKMKQKSKQNEAK
jgi:hypothetical protein